MLSNSYHMLSNSYHMLLKDSNTVMCCVRNLICCIKLDNTDVPPLRACGPEGKPPPGGEDTVDVGPEGSRGGA